MVVNVRAGIFSPLGSANPMARKMIRAPNKSRQCDIKTSASPQDMDLPGLYLHQLKGRHRGRWSVRVSGNWRVTFKFDGPDAIDIDFEDYH